MTTRNRKEANNAIEVPAWFIPGFTFLGKWIENNTKCTVISFDKENNRAAIKIETTTSEWQEDDWNLQHTIWGFDNGDYRRMPQNMHSPRVEG